jgi:CRP/FNR family transcriptional regulator, transcriptional activator FtrB
MQKARQADDTGRRGGDQADHPWSLPARADDRPLNDARFFSSLAPDLQARLTKAGKFRNLARDTVLWRRGDRAKHVYVLVSGRIGVVDAPGEDRTTVISLFGPGHFITGASGIFDVPYAFSGRVIEDARVLAVPVAPYRRYVMSDTSFLLMTTMNVCAHWRELMVQVRDLKQLSANQRLGFYLLAKTRKRSGSETIHLADDQMLIAGMLGVTRESLSRSFAQLHEHGVIKRGRIVVLDDITRLRRLCQDRP